MTYQYGKVVLFLVRFLENKTEDVANSLLFHSVDAEFIHLNAMVPLVFATFNMLKKFPVYCFDLIFSVFGLLVTFSYYFGKKIFQNFYSKITPLILRNNMMLN